MKVDLFLCTLADEFDEIRYHLYKAVYYRWCADQNISLNVITPDTTKVAKLTFQGYRLTYAEEHATSDIYIVADDDLMPIGSTFIQRGLDVMNKHPEAELICSRILDEPVYPGSGDVITEKDAYFTACGFRWIRKGHIGDILPGQNSPYFDGCRLTQLMRERGQKVWKMRDVWVNHLGFGMSTVWPVREKIHTQLSDVRVNGTSPDVTG